MYNRFGFAQDIYDYNNLDIKYELHGGEKFSLTIKANDIFQSNHVACFPSKTDYTSYPEFIIEYLTVITL